MAHLVVFQPDARVEARLSDALNATHRVSAVRSWAALSAFVVTENVDGCVVDADYPNREEALTHIRRVRRRHPGIALVAYADLDDGALELYRFGSLGMDGVVLAGRPPWTSSIRDAMERSLATARANRVRTTLEGRFPPQAISAVAWSVEHAGRCPTVAAYAAGLGHTPRSLGRLLRESGLPPANRLLLWGRLLLAGALLNSDERTVEEAAFQLGYSTATALARAMKREVGRTPTEVAHQGGLAFVQGRLFPRGRTHRRRRRTKLGTIALGAAISLHASACATAAPAGRGGDAERAAISGLSASNLVTPRALVRILRYTAAGRDDGQQIVFSILSNGSGLPSSRVRAAIDDVVAVLAGRHP